MCARFSLTSPIEALRHLFQLNQSPNLAASYNIAPTDEIFAVRLSGTSTPAMTCFKARWGLIPVWLKEASSSPPLINARSETIHEKPSFRKAFKSRRCLIPANGFFEWQKLEDGSKQPYYIQATTQTVFSFAGVWENWIDVDGSSVESCAILTQAADAEFATLHNRMPVTVNSDNYMKWLTGIDRATLPARPEQASFRSYPVDKRVGNVRENDADLIKKIDLSAKPMQGSLF